MPTCPRCGVTIATEWGLKKHLGRKNPCGTGGGGSADTIPDDYDSDNSVNKKYIPITIPDRTVECQSVEGFIVLPYTEMYCIQDPPRQLCLSNLMKVFRLVHKLDEGYSVPIISIKPTAPKKTFKYISGLKEDGTYIVSKTTSSDRLDIIDEIYQGILLSFRNKLNELLEERECHWNSVKAQRFKSSDVDATHPEISDRQLLNGELSHLVQTHSRNTSPLAQDFRREVLALITKKN